MEIQDGLDALRHGLIQSDRLIKLDTPLGLNVLLPQRVVGCSRMGRDQEFIIDLISNYHDLELKKLIAQSVTLWLQQSDRSYLPHHGYVKSVRRLGFDGDLSHYQITFASWLNFLKLRKDARIWQDKSTAQILNELFNCHPQARGAFRFDLRLKASQAVPQRSYCVQYESDWNFAMRLMEDEGWYGFIEQAADGKSHTYVIADSLDACAALSPHTVAFHRADAAQEAATLTQWGGVRTLQSTKLTTRTFDYKHPGNSNFPKKTSIPTLQTQGNLPSQMEVYTYGGAYAFAQQARGDRLTQVRMEEWESRAKRFFASGGVRDLDAGRWFELTGCPAHRGDSQPNRQFGIIESRWFIENNLPVSATVDFPFSLKAQLDQVKAQQASGAGGVLVPHPDGGQGFFLAQIEVQRKAIPFHSPFEHHKPTMSLQTATVVGPAHQEVYTDELNRIKVRMHWDRLNPGNENASSWMRVAYSNAGGGTGGIHVPRIGDEVQVNWLDSDCDRPLVVGRAYNGANKPHWHSNGLLSGYKSKEHQGDGFNQLVMDDATGQNRTQLYSTSTNAHLHLGYLIDQNGNSRGGYIGSGFDLKTESYGALRAGRGLYVSTYPAGMGSQPLDARAASSQLINSENLLESMSQASEAHLAESLQEGYDSARAFTDATHAGISVPTSGGITAGGGTGYANGFKDPIMLLASPAGIALSTLQSNQIYADRQINLVSGLNTYIATGKSLLAGITEKLSLFVQNAGMKLFAAKGKVEIQAQSDKLELTAQKTLKLVSAADKIQAAAKQEILLTAGGAYIRLADGNIEIHAPGTVSIKGVQHALSGPARMDIAHPAWPNALPTQKLLLSTGASPSSLSFAPAGMPYTLLADGAVVKHGVIDGTGHIPLEHHVGVQNYQLELANGITHEIPVPTRYRGDAVNGALANRGFQFHEMSAAADITPAGDRASHRSRYSNVLDNASDTPSGA